MPFFHTRSSTSGLRILIISLASIVILLALALRPTAAHAAECPNEAVCVEANSTFETVPDVPISSFTLKLPEGPHSALAANGNLCKRPLLMPTTITGQNGAQVEQKTKIKVTGCPAAKASVKVTRPS